MITEQRVNELLTYEHQTGTLRWRHSRGGNAAGSEAGTIGDYGYRVIKIDKRRYLAQRLIWLIEYGYLPRRIHRLNKDKLDNRITNLVDFDKVKASIAQV